jgi:hypothetical protein
VGQSGVTQASQRIALKRSQDKNLRKIVKRIEKNILLSDIAMVITNYPLKRGMKK